jgi:hypothetical protein
VPLENLERLMERKQLSRHKPTRREVENHLSIARAFRDAANLRGTPERVRFHNLYEAAQAVALAGLKLAGYRANGLAERRAFSSAFRLAFHERPMTVSNVRGG